MKKYLLIITFSIASISASFGQQFWEMIEQGTYTVQQIQSEAEKYFTIHGRGNGSGYKQYQVWEYRALLESDANGKIISPIQIEKELKKFHGSPQNMPLSSVASWLEMGPKQRNPSSSWNPGVGRVDAIAVDPNNYNHILIGAPTGGAWKTTDGGATWIPLTDFLTNLNTLAVAIDPNNSSTYFIGTTAGIYKSIDAGSTWTKVYSNYIIKKLKVKLDNSSIILAATSNGVLRSTNGGTTWTSVLSNPSYDLEFKPGSPNVAYVCQSGAVYYSIDGGATWAAATGLGGYESRIAVTDLDATYVYFINSDSEVYRSTNSGVSFTKTSSATPTAVFGTLFYYGMGFAVSNTDKNILFAGSKELYKSPDGGASFSLFVPWTWGNASGKYIHADLHALEAVGPYIFSGTDGGIHKGANEGAAFTDLSTGLGIRQFYRIGVSKTEAGKVIGGAQDNGTAVMSGVNHSWVEFLGADGTEAFVDWSNPNQMVGTTQYGEAYFSSDNGTTYTGWGEPGGIDGAWVSPMEQDPMDASTMYLANTSLYKKTIPNGAWTLVSASPSGNKITQMRIAPSNSSYIYISTGTTLNRSVDKGLTWTNIYSGISDYGGINWIAVHPEDPAKVAVISSSYNVVYESSNAGTTWTKKKLNLPSIPAQCLVYQKGNKNGLYIGMSVGVYYIDDTFTTWQVYSNKLPNVSISEMEIDESSGLLYAGTYGRGLWVSPLYGQSINVDFTSDTQSPLNCAPVVFTAQITGGTGTSYAWNFGAGAIPATANTAGPHTVIYSTTGTKDISLTVDGFIKSKTAYITVSQDQNILPAVDIAFTSGSNPTCKIDSLRFTATATHKGTSPIYEWYNGVNLIQSGSSKVFITSSYNSGDEIRCKLISNEACAVTTTATSDVITIIVDVCTGIEGELKNKISIAPNPATNYLMIRNSFSAEVQYHIYNSIGQLVSIGSMNIGSKKIDFSSYAKGIYYIKITSGEAKMIQKIIKD